jgi:hypothetical protein
MIADSMVNAVIQMTMRYAQLSPSHKLAALERPMEPRTDTKTDTTVEVHSDLGAQLVM